jgi:hypothetical protein
MNPRALPDMATRERRLEAFRAGPTVEAAVAVIGIGRPTYFAMRQAAEDGTAKPWVEELADA